MGASRSLKRQWRPAALAFCAALLVASTCCAQAPAEVLPVEAPAAEAEPPPGASPGGPAESAGPVAGEPGEGPVEAGGSQQLADPAAPPRYWTLASAALAARGAGRFDEAHRLMREAHASWPSARSLRALGVLAVDRDRPVDAVRYLGAALGTEARALDGPLRQRTTELLEAARARIAVVRVTADPYDARVELDGRETALAPLLAMPGAHIVRVSAPGHDPRVERVFVGAGETLQLAARLRVHTAAPDTTESARRAVWWRRPWLLGTAGAAVVVAVATTLAVTLPRVPGYDGGNIDRVAGS